MKHTANSRMTRLAQLKLARRVVSIVRRERDDLDDLDATVEIEMTDYGTPGLADWCRANAEQVSTPMFLRRQAG